MIIKFELAFRGGNISCTFDGYSREEAERGFWDLVREEEGEAYAEAAKAFGCLWVEEVHE